MHIVNTFEAHVLLEYTHDFGKQTDLKMCLFTAYFSERKNVSKREVLRQALLEIGLNEDDGLALLDNEEVSSQVRKNKIIGKV